MTTYAMPEIDYPTQFRQNVMRSVQAVLGRVQDAPTATLNEAIRSRIFAVLDYALQLDEAWPTVRELLRALGPKFNLGGYWAQWLPYVAQGIKIGERHQDQTTVAALSCDLGLLHQRLGKLDLAETYLLHACTVARANQAWAILGMSLQQLAEVERFRRHYQECQALLAEAAALFPPDDPAQAPGLFIKGKAALDQHDLTAATTAFTTAMNLWETTGNQGRIALCIHNLGRIAVARGEPKTAIPIYEQALALLTAAGDWSNIPVVTLNLGTAYYLCQNYEAAQTLYRETESSFQLMNDDRMLAMVYNNLGLVHTVHKEWREAETYLERSLILHQHSGDKKAWINTKGNLGIAYLEQAQYNQAIHTFQEALAELQTTPQDAEYERLWREITKYLTQAQEHGQQP